MTQSKNYYGQKSQSAEGHKDRTDFKTIMTVTATEENKSVALYSLVCMDWYLHTYIQHSANRTHFPTALSNIHTHTLIDALGAT